MGHFIESVMANVKGKQKEIFEQAFVEELTIVIEEDPTLEELYQVLKEAQEKGLLNEMKLSTLLPKGQKPGVNATGNKERPERLTEVEKQEGMKKVATILFKSDKPMTKAEVLDSKDEGELLSQKWPSIINALRKDGFVQDNGEKRQKKGYLLTDLGKNLVDQVA